MSIKQAERKTLNPNKKNNSDKKDNPNTGNKAPKVTLPSPFLQRHEKWLDKAWRLEAPEASRWQAAANHRGVQFESGC